MGDSHATSGPVRKPGGPDRARAGNPRTLVSTSDERAGARDALSRSCWRVPKSNNNTTVASKLGLHPRRSPSGATDSSCTDWRVCTTSPGPEPPRSIDDDAVETVIVKTLEETPTDATHWSTRSMAKATGMSQSAVSRIWRAFGLKPHLVETFKLSPDPLFIEKVRDIVGLYVNPPEACARVVRGREVPDPGPRPDPADPAAAARRCLSDEPMTTCEAAPPTCSRHSTSPRAR